MHLNIRSRSRVSWSIYWGDKGPESTDDITFAGEAQQLDNIQSTQLFADTLYDQRFPDPTERKTHPPILSDFEQSERNIFILRPTLAYKVDRRDPKGVSRRELDLSVLKQADIKRFVMP